MLSAQDLRFTFNPAPPIETQSLARPVAGHSHGAVRHRDRLQRAGKSTVPELGLRRPKRWTAGTIKIDGLDVTQTPVRARSERVARVFQDPMAGTCEDLTIEENMALAQCRGSFRS